MQRLALCSASSGTSPPGDTEGALAALEHAIRVDPYTQELYRRMIRLQAQLGRPDAARGTYRLRIPHRFKVPDAGPARLL